MPDSFDNVPATLVHTGVPPSVHPCTLLHFSDRLASIELAEGTGITPGAPLLLELGPPGAPRLLGHLLLVTGTRAEMAVTRVVPRDRRNAPRYTTALTMRFRAVGGTWEEAGPTIEVALGGVAFDTRAALPVGTRVELEFTVPGEARTIQGRGQVVRLETPPDAEPRVAVALDPEQREAASAFGRISRSVQDQLLLGSPPAPTGRRHPVRR